MKISIVGLGFVGLSLASVLASKNYTVVGIDKDKKKCNEIRNGKVPIYEPDLEKTLKIEHEYNAFVCLHIYMNITWN